MNRQASRAIHRATCRDEECPICERRAEERAADIEPDYDVEVAENSYERSLGW